MLKWITILRLQYRLTVLEIYLILKKKFKIFFSLYVYFLASRKQANFVCTRYSIHKKLLFEKIYINTGSEWQEHRLLYFFFIDLIVDQMSKTTRHVCLYLLFMWVCFYFYFSFDTMLKWIKSICLLIYVSWFLCFWAIQLSSHKKLNKSKEVLNANC